METGQKRWSWVLTSFYVRCSIINSWVKRLGETPELNLTITPQPSEYLSKEYETPFHT